MAFCTNCGAPLEGTFCGKCGARADAPAPGQAQPPAPPPPVPPAGFTPQPQPPTGPPAGFMPAPPVPPPPVAPKKVSPWMWVLGGCLILVFLVIVGVVGTTWFVARKVKQAGDNPALAAARLMIMANPDIEEVSSDQAKGTVTLREKKTGKVMTLNFDDIKKGHISFEADGQKVDVDASGQGDSGSIVVKSGEGTARFGAGSAVDLPAWLPKYPGAKAEGNFSAQSAKGAGGAFSFTTSDSVDKVAGFYEQALKTTGLTVERTSTGGNTAQVAGNGDSPKREVTVIIGTEGGSTRVAVTYGGN